MRERDHEHRRGGGEQATRQRTPSERERAHYATAQRYAASARAGSPARSARNVGASRRWRLPPSASSSSAKTAAASSSRSASASLNCPTSQARSSSYR